MSESPRHSILVVDDEPDICRNLADILENFGYEVTAALSGEEALEIVRQKKFDVALLDLKMPGMDGLTLYRKIREEKAEVVAVIVTAYATPQTARDALLAGARQVLAKPVDIAQLLDLVDEAVHQPMVMVVDDDVDLCQSLWEVFREHGLRVCITHTESDAVRRLQERDFQVVLVDLKLPEGDGQRVLETIRDQAPETRSILITGHRDELERKLHAPSAPQADAVCYKPFQIPELLDAIARLAQRQN